MEIKIIKTDHRGETNYSVDKSFRTCHTNGQFSSGVSIGISTLNFRTVEECESVISDIIASKPIVYKGHRIERLFFTSKWKMVYVDLSWRYKDYGTSKQYIYSYSLEDLKSDIDEKEDKPKKSIFKIFQLT